MYQGYSEIEWLEPSLTLKFHLSSTFLRTYTWFDLTFVLSMAWHKLDLWVIHKIWAIWTVIVHIKYTASYSVLTWHWNDCEFLCVAICCETMVETRENTSGTKNKSTSIRKLYWKNKLPYFILTILLCDKETEKKIDDVIQIIVDKCM